MAELVGVAIVAGIMGFVMGMAVGTIRTMKIADGYIERYKQLSQEAIDTVRLLERRGAR